MPTSIRPNPVMKAVTVSDGGAHQLTALLKAAYPTVHIPDKCSQLRIRLDIDAPTDLFIGNDDVSSTNWAEHLTQGGYFDSFARDANDFPLQDIYVLPGSAAATIIGATILEQ